MARHIILSSGAPAAAPESVGQHYIDTVNKKAYTAVGTADPSDWDPGGGGDDSVSTIYDNGDSTGGYMVLDWADGPVQSVTLVEPTEVVLPSPPDEAALCKFTLWVQGGFNGAYLLTISSFYGVQFSTLQGSAEEISARQYPTPYTIFEFLFFGGEWRGRLLSTDKMPS